MRRRTRANGLSGFHATRTFQSSATAGGLRGCRAMTHLSTTAGACMRAAAGRLYSLRLHYRGSTTGQAGITCVISMVRGKRCPHARFKGLWD